MKEKLLERKLRIGVERLGGNAVKFASPYLAGMPDRIVLMPGGKVAFAEIKTTGKKPTKLQQLRLARLRELGFTAAVIDSQDMLDGFLDFLKYGL